MTDKEKNRLSKEEDFEAIRKVLDGDDRAFEFLQKKYKPRITALIRRMLKDSDDIEDMVQESFIKAYKALPTFQFGYTFSAWIYRIASNNTIDFLRKKRFQHISIDKPYGEDEDSYFDIKDEDPLPDIELITSERKKILDEAIENLNDGYKEIIKLRHKEELDYKEIADKLDLPLGTVKAHLFRARKALYEALKDKKHIIRHLE